MTTSETKNRLSESSSLYLTQHKDNPVAWWPYCDEALELAQKENKPIFLSIGYSSCHWCHVMAHESFESQEIADLLNDDFICIKVDREEHPDVDRFYQRACQAYTGRGGWPLSVFLTPKMNAYFVGTYFPHPAKQGMPGFKEIIEKLKEAYQSDQETIQQNAEALLEAVTRPTEMPEKKVEFQGDFPHPQSMITAVRTYMDKDHGGFGEAPKFPMFGFLEFATDYILEGLIEQDDARTMLQTVERMVMGGIYDQARGGIHRYSTDKEWLVPHFEKMLYDQAGLLSVLTKATLVYPSPLFFDAILQTLDYLKSEMQSDKGYFFSAQDADSEGREGVFFSFTEQEFEEAIINYDNELEKELGKLKKWFGITKEGNFEDGMNVISLSPEHKDEYLEQEGFDLIRKVRMALREERKERIPPATDTKGIASWNFLMLNALVDVAQYTNVDVIHNTAMELLQPALQGCFQEFLSLDENENTKLRHSNTLESGSYFEDYAFFANCQFRIFEITGEETFKENSLKTLEFIFDKFYKDGRFYTRNIESERSDFENIEVSPFDESFKSAFAHLIGLVRRVGIVHPELKYWEKIQKNLDVYKQNALLNPIGSGELLRSLTYPQDAYRKVEVPKTYIKDERFLRLIPFFSTRFVLNYTEGNEWQFCSHTACEKNGKDIESFLELFNQTPEKQDAE